MLGPRYIPNPLQQLNHEHDFYMHQKKLNDIHKEDRKKKTIDREGLAKTKLVEVREKNIKFHVTEKNMAIEKDNELLLGRLVEISRKKKSVLFGAKSEVALPRTLNGPSRRREKDRIALENEAFARRLLSQQPCFDRKKLDSDYEKHNTRVKNMQRLLASSPKRVKLPPLKSTDFEARKSTSGNNTRDAEKKKQNSKRNNQIAETEEEHQDEHERQEKAKAEEKAKQGSLQNSQTSAQENTTQQENKEPESSATHVTDSAQLQAEQASPKTGAEELKVDEKVPESGSSQPDSNLNSATVEGDGARASVANENKEQTQSQVQV